MSDEQDYGVAKMRRLVREMAEFGSDGAVQALVLLVMASREDGTITHEEGAALAAWWGDVSVTAGLMENVFEGTLAVSVAEGELAFKITEAGMKAVEAMGAVAEPTP